MKEIINAFKYFDRKNNGKIDISELKFSLTHFRNKLSNDEFNNIFKKVNVDIEQNLDFYYMKVIDFFNNK